MRRKAIAFIAAAALMTMCLASCSRAGSLSQERDQALRKQTGDILVGVAWPFASRNDGFREGLQLALDEINEHGVLGHRLQLIEQDDNNSVTEGLEIAQSFSGNLKLTAVIGHRSSAVTVPAAQDYDHAGLLLLAPSSTAPALTASGMERVIRLIPNDKQIGSAMAKFAFAQGYRHAAIFYTNDEYGRGLANAFEDEAERNGTQIVDRVSDYKDLNDLRRLADKWKLLGCDAVFVAESMPEGAALISDLRKAGVEAPILGGDGLDSAALAETAGEAAEQAVVASIFDPTDKADAVQQFVRRYKDRYGAEPGKMAAQGYDALQLLAYALTKAGTREPTKLAETLKGTKSWQGVAGLHSFDGQGDVSGMPIILKRLEGGKFHYLP